MTPTDGRRAQIRVAYLMRITSVLAGVYQVFFGELVIGIYILLAAAAITLPAVFTRGRIRSIPLELELVFFAMVILQFVIGETLDFYQLIPYYDKFVHLSLPFFIGLVGFFLAYALHLSGGLDIKSGPMVIIIVFLTMGIGAAWEIVEYLSDTFLSPIFPFFGNLQGTVHESPFLDTMHDLIADTIGGLFGALLGLRYISSDSPRIKLRLANLMKGIRASFYRKPVEARTKAGKP